MNRIEGDKLVFNVPHFEKNNSTELTCLDLFYAKEKELVKEYLLHRGDKERYYAVFFHYADGGRVDLLETWVALYANDNIYTSPSTYILFGIKAYSDGEHQQAENAFQKYIAHDNDNFRVHTILSSFYSKFPHGVVMKEIIMTGKIPFEQLKLLPNVGPLKPLTDLLHVLAYINSSTAVPCEMIAPFKDALDSFFPQFIFNFLGNNKILKQEWIYEVLKDLYIKYPYKISIVLSFATYLYRTGKFNELMPLIEKYLDLQPSEGCSRIYKDLMIIKANVLIDSKKYFEAYVTSEYLISNDRMDENIYFNYIKLAYIIRADVADKEGFDEKLSIQIRRIITLFKEDYLKLKKLLVLLSNKSVVFNFPEIFKAFLCSKDLKTPDVELLANNPFRYDEIITLHNQALKENVKNEVKVRYSRALNLISCFTNSDLMLKDIDYLQHNKFEPTYILILKVFYYLLQKDYDEAALLLFVVEVNTPLVIYAKAYLAFKQNKILDAQMYSKELFKKNEGLIFGYKINGMIAFQLNEFKLAIECFDKFPEMKDRESILYYFKSLVALNRFEDALKLFESLSPFEKLTYHDLKVEYRAVIERKPIKAIKAKILP